MPTIRGCSCVCKCFGFFQYDEWPNTISQENHLELPELGEGDIKILYRSHIKLFVKRNNAEKSKSPKKKEESFYSFTGLRGDAKQLYFDITEGREKRVGLVYAPTILDQRNYIADADVVVWACGYQSNNIPIYDVNKKELALSQKVPNTQFDVDGKCRIMLADGNVLKKCFACGVGFPVRTKDGGPGAKDPALNPRADGYRLYMNTVAEMLLKSLLPKRKMASIVDHKEIANPWLKGATFEQLLKQNKEKQKHEGKLASVLDLKVNIKSKDKITQLTPKALALIG